MPMLYTGVIFKHLRYMNKLFFSADLLYCIYIYILLVFNEDN